MIEQIKALLIKKRFAFIPEVFEIRLLDNGAYNTNYVVEGNGKKFVFRVNSHIDAAAGHGLNTEHQILEFLEGTVAPTPFFVDTSCQEFPLPYRIESFVEGEVPLQFTQGLILQIAKNFAIVHKKRFSHCGRWPGTSHRYSLGTSVSPAFGIKEIQTPEILELIEKAKKYIDHFDRAIFDSLKSFALIHNDLHIKNLLVDGNRVVFVDWEYAEIGDPAADIAVFFWFSALFGYAKPFDEETKEMFIEQYVALSGDRKIRERITIQEPVVVFWQTLWYLTQLANVDNIPSHIRTPQRIASYNHGARLGLDFIKKHGFRFE